MKKIKWSTVTYLALTLLAIIFAVTVIGSYLLPASSSLSGRVAAHSPYPVVLVHYTQWISFRTLAANVASVKQFYENQDFAQIGLRVDFSTDEGKKRLKVREKEVLNKMIEDQAIEFLAKQRGIVVSKAMAEQGVARKLEEYGKGAEVAKNLERLYGWSLDDFEEKVVLPSLYQDKLEQAFRQEVDTTGAAKTKIDQAQAALTAGQDFAAVAKTFSEGETASSGGELGWFALEDLAPELRKPVTLQKVGASGQVIESSLGYHIVVVEETKKDADKQLYRLRQIFARKALFADWLTEQMRTLPVWVLSPDYVWDKQTARVEFRSGALKEFEAELSKKTNGDAAFFF